MTKPLTAEECRAFADKLGKITTEKLYLHPDETLGEFRDRFRSDPAPPAPAWVGQQPAEETT